MNYLNISAFYFISLHFSITASSPCTTSNLHLLHHPPFLTFLLEVTHKSKFMFIHVIIHVKSSLHPFLQNSTFCILMIIKANSDNNVCVEANVTVAGNKPTPRVTERTSYDITFCRNVTPQK